MSVSVVNRAAERIAHDALHSSASSPSATVLTDTDRVIVQDLGQTKRKIAVLVKIHFIKFSLPDLQANIPKDAGLVAFFPECTRTKVTEELSNCFDLVIYYDNSTVIYNDLIRCVQQVKIPPLSVFLNELVELVPREKIALIHSEEASTLEISRERERLGLQGAQLNDVMPLYRKEIVAEIADQNGIPTPRTVFADFSRPQSKQALLSEIVKKIGKFPMFAKPSMLLGTIGTSAIASQKELEQWIDDRLADENSSGYVVQEYIVGREFYVVTVLLADGSWVPLALKYLATIGNHESFYSGKPMISVVEQFEKAEKGEFPNIREFAAKVIGAYRPVHPQMFCIQGFQRKARSSDYVLCELSYRPVGAPTHKTLYESCGLNQHVAMILAHVDPTYYPRPPPEWKPKIQCSIWYHHKEGVLNSHNPLPAKPHISGTVVAEWKKSPGTKLPSACRSSHVTVTLVLESASDEERERDAKWISENWKPDIRK